MELNLGFLCSHNGSNMQAIVDACKSSLLSAKSCVIISNNIDSYALERAKNEGIPHYHISSKTHPGNEEDLEIVRVLQRHHVNILLLAGYMKRLGPQTLKSYEGKILNIHPALLPKFGGKGMYGKHVHQSVLEAKEKVTGVTIHLVDENYDTGRIINQCQVPVYENDTVDSLSQRVLKREHEFFVETLQKISKGTINL